MEVVEGDCLCGKPERMETRDGKPVLVRCPLYCKLYVNAAGGEKREEWKCAIAWMPILQIENAAETKAVASYIESFRNETVARVDAAQRRVLPHRPRVIGEILEAQDAPTE